MGIPRENRFRSPSFPEIALNGKLLVIMGGGDENEDRSRAVGSANGVRRQGGLISAWVAVYRGFVQSRPGRRRPVLIQAARQTTDSVPSRNGDRALNESRVVPR